MPGQIWNETFPAPDHMAGMGAIQIPLPEGYQAKNWRVQLRWPHEMMKVICFTDTVVDGDCDGEGQGSPESGVQTNIVHSKIKRSEWGNIPCEKDCSKDRLLCYSHKIEFVEP